MSNLGNRIEHERTVTSVEEKLKRMNDKEVLKALTTRQNQEKVKAYDLLRRAGKELKDMDRLAGYRESLAEYQRRVDLVDEIEALLGNKIEG